MNINEVNFDVLLEKHKEPIDRETKQPAAYMLWGMIGSHNESSVITEAAEIREMPFAGSLGTPTAVFALLKKGWKLLKYKLPIEQNLDLQVALETAKGGSIALDNERAARIAAEEELSELKSRLEKRKKVTTDEQA